MFDREMYAQSDTEVQDYFRCTPAGLGNLYGTLKQALKEYNLYGKRIDSRHETRFANLLNASWNKHSSKFPHASYHDGLRAMGSLALNMNRNIQKRRKDRKRENRAALTSAHSTPIIDEQALLPHFVKQEAQSVTLMPPEDPEHNSRIEKHTSVPRRSILPSWLEPERIPIEQERERSPELLIPELSNDAFSEGAPSNESQNFDPADDALTDREVSPESHVSDDTLAEHSLSKLVILVASKKHNGMKLCYQFRDLVPRTGKPQSFCIDQMKWDVFSKSCRRR